VWRREVVVEGKNPRGWRRPYISIGKGFQYMYVSCSMYVGCNGNNCVCTRVPGRTVMYVGTCSFGKEQVHTC
jgi:hypothetical protein